MEPALSKEDITNHTIPSGEGSPGVLIVQRSANLDGSAFSALLLANGFRDAGWKVLVAFGFEGPIIDQFWEAGHEAVVAPHDNWLRRDSLPRFIKDYFAEWRKARAFLPFLSNRDFDLVYINSVVSLAGAVAARQSRTSCIWHLRELFASTGGEMHCPKSLLPLVRWTLRNLATNLVSNSKAVAEDLLGKDDAKNCLVVPNAAQDAFFQNSLTKAEARQKLSLPALGKIIGLPGTLRPMKGHTFLFSGAAPLLREDPTLCLAVTGDGEPGYRRELEQQLDVLGIREQTRFLGTIQQMPAFYRACDLVCIPSRAEPFGRTVIESFASGTPVVASAVGGILEIVRDGENGLLVPYGKNWALEEALRRLLAERDLTKKLSEAALRDARARYQESAYQRNLVGLAHNLIRPRSH